MPSNAGSYRPPLGEIHHQPGRYLCAVKLLPTADTPERIAEHEPGTPMYLIHTVEGEPRSRVIYEVYRDRISVPPADPPH